MKMCFVLKWPLLYQAFHQRRLVKSPTLSNLFSNGPKYIPTEQPKRNSENILQCACRAKYFLELHFYMFDFVLYKYYCIIIFFRRSITVFHQRCWLLLHCHELLSSNVVPSFMCFTYRSPKGQNHMQDCLTGGRLLGNTN